MQLLFGVAIVTLGAIVQGTVLTRLPLSPRPDLVLLLVLAWSMLRGMTEGTIGGIVGGMALDLLSAAPFGAHTVLLGAIGFLAALGEANVFRGSVPLFSLTAALATLVLHGGSVLALQLVGQQAVGLVRFVQFVVPAAAANAICMPVVYLLVRRGVRALSGWRQLEL